MSKAIQVLRKGGDTILTISKNVPHVFEVTALSNPYISIHDESTATFKIGVREMSKGVGLFRIVQMNNGGDPNSTVAGISMTMDHKVGIGTEKPQERLHVYGNLRVDGEILVPQYKRNSTIDKKTVVASEESLSNLISDLFNEIHKLNQRVKELESDSKS
jgi:hypothetical protein